MNISNGHNGAQGHTLPEKHNTGAFAYGLSEDRFGKLTRARNACDMLQLLFSEYPSQAGALDAGCADHTDHCQFRSAFSAAMLKQ